MRGGLRCLPDDSLLTAKASIWPNISMEDCFQDKDEILKWQPRFVHRKPPCVVIANAYSQPPLDCM